ncbi:MAG: hypothetical protein ACP5IZ_11730 [Thermoprotei archaeon]
MDERILTVLSKLSKLKNEIDFNPSLKDVGEDVDEKAFKMLLFLDKGKADKIYEHEILSVGSDLSPSASQKLFSVIDELKKFLEKRKITRTYGYAIIVNSNANILSILYASSVNYFQRFDELVNEYTSIIRSLNGVLWETIEYIKYLNDYEKYEKTKNQVYEFYSKYKQFIDVYIDEYNFIIFCPIQIKGLLIGSKGATVKKLEEKIGRKITIKEDEILSEKYRTEYDSWVNVDTEVAELLTDVLQKLKILEKKGINAKRVLELYESNYR